MPDASVIKEFLVGIGFKTDQSAQQRAQKGIQETGAAASKLAAQIEAATKALGDLGKALAQTAAEPARKFKEVSEEVQRRNEIFRKGIVELGRTALATTTGFVAGMRQVAQQYQELYYITQRTGASAQNLMALAAAFQSVGMGSEGAAAGIAHMQELFQTAPGREPQFLAYAGRYMDEMQRKLHTTDKATLEFYSGLEALSKMPAYLQKQFGEQWYGWSYAQTRRMIDNREREAKAFADEKQYLDDIGLSQEKLQKIERQGVELSTDFANVWRHFGYIFTQAFSEVEPLLHRILGYVDDIIKAVEKFNDQVPGAATVEALGIAGGAWVAFRGILNTVTGAFRGVTAAAGEAAAASAAPKLGLLGRLGGIAAVAGAGIGATELARDTQARRQKTGEGWLRSGLETLLLPEWLQKRIAGPAEGAPHFQAGGIVPIAAHAGEMVLPRPISEGLQQLFGGGGSGDRTEAKNTSRKLGDWLGGAANAPKVVIDNIEDFVRQFADAYKREEGRASGRAAGTAAGGGTAGGAGGGAAPAAPAPTTAGGAAGAAAGAVAGHLMGGAQKAAASFAGMAPRVIASLQHDLGLTKEQAAGVVGNLGVESGGFTQYAEAGGRGPGVGWAQWTSRDRKAGFLRYAAQHHIDPRSPEASYGYLVEEMQKPEFRKYLSALRAAKTPEEAAMITQQMYERPGIPHTERRLQMARQAYAMRIPQTHLAGAGLAPSAQAGGIVPILAHAGEMVLPRELSSGLQRLIAGGGLGGRALGGDTHNRYGDRSVTINQTNNHQFSGGEAAMMGRMRDMHERLTGDLVRNFRAALA